MYTDTEKRENVVRGAHQVWLTAPPKTGGTPLCELRRSDDMQMSPWWTRIKDIPSRKTGRRKRGSAGQQAHSLGGMGSQTAGVEAAEDGPLPDEQLWNPPLLSLVAHFF